MRAAINEKMLGNERAHIVPTPYLSKILAKSVKFGCDKRTIQLIKTQVGLKN